MKERVRINKGSVWELVSGLPDLLFFLPPILT